jgi:hypothetical protein
MTTLSKRVKALEGDLSPRQLIMTLLDRMASFEDLDGFIAWCYTDVALKQMQQSRENMYAAIRRKHPGQKVKAADQACQKAHRAFNYLFDLAMAPSTQLDLARYRYLYLVSHVAHELGALWRHFQTEYDLDALIQELSHLKRQLEPLRVELISEHLASETIGQKYFGGRPLFFKGQEAFLELVMSQVQGMAEHLNEAIGLLRAIKPEAEIWDTLLIDEPAVQVMAEALAVCRVEQLEQEARLIVYEAEGRHEEAVRYFKKVFLD